MVVASAAEAEYGALFTNAQDAEALRTALSDLGYPQEKTTIICDNSCAVGIANDTVKERRSKAFDSKLHWIRDRVAQGHFAVRWEPGATNMADLLTKAHSAQHHQRVRRFYVDDSNIMVDLSRGCIDQHPPIDPIKVELKYDKSIYQTITGRETNDSSTGSRDGIKSPLTNQLVSSQ
jgi:hypothetical protein